MSSIIGHSILGFYASQLFVIKDKSWKWNVWLIFLAIAPDFNYVALWFFGTQTILRFSHSIIFVTILPFFSFLFLRYKNNHEILKKTFLLFISSYFHILSDLFVGSTSKSYFWPFYQKNIKLPFGFLPSAGKLDLGNYYLYRNLLIELCIFLPPAFIIYMFRNKHTTINNFWIKFFLVVIIWISFLIFGVLLFRD